jgi:hypothetical protein
VVRCHPVPRQGKPSAFSAAVMAFAPFPSARSLRIRSSAASSSGWSISLYGSDGSGCCPNGQRSARVIRRRPA